MIVISQERVDEVKAIKDEIGWSWNTVAFRLGWTPHQMRQVQGLKIPIADEHIEWLLAVKAAIDTVPVPGPEVFMPNPEMFQPPAVQDVKVMLLEDIVTKLVDEYFVLDDQADSASADEIAGARYMVGRLADRCGVADEVRDAIKARQLEAVLAPPENHFPLAPFLPPRPSIGSQEAIEVRPTVGNPFARRERVPMED